LLIEPKPYETTKHQYDSDITRVFAFLQKYGLEKEFKVNIEANHATLAGHSFPHEVAYAYNNNIFGGIDANRGDSQVGWEKDQFPTHLSEIVQVLYLILQHGGFTTGGFNFDTQLRKHNPEPMDMFQGYISGIDTLARGLIIAANLTNTGELDSFIQNRYRAWQSKLGQDILNGKMDFEEIANHALDHDVELSF
jgi:xylose isomerase